MRQFGRQLEVSAGLAWQSLDAGTLPWQGWQDHPVLNQQMDRAASAPGQRLGFGRATMLGATARMTLLLGDVLTLGVTGSLLQQTEGNATVLGSTRSFRAGPARVLEGGGELGAVGLFGPITLRGGVFAGYRHLSAEIEGLGLAGCDSIPVVTSGRWVVVPRGQISASISRHVAIGVMLGLDATRPQDWQGAVVLSVHGGGFAQVTPELAGQ